MNHTLNTTTPNLNPLYLVKKTLIKEGKLHKAQLEMAKKPQIL
jgi:hypothetical protein